MARQVTVGLAANTSILRDAGRMLFIDADSMLGEVFGHAKHGAAFGHAKVDGYQVRQRGYHPLIATLATPATRSPLTSSEITVTTPVTRPNQNPGARR